MSESPPWAFTHGGLQKLGTDLRILNYEPLGGLFQVVCSAISGLLHSAVWFQLLELLQHGSPHVVVEGVQLWAVWRPGILVGELWVVLSFCSVAKFVLESCISVHLAYRGTSSKCSTKQHICAKLCAKQMSNIWCKNIRAFWDISVFVLGHFILPHPV